MYNEELKKRFIAERKNEAVLPDNYLVNRFSQSEEYEEEFGKDLCNFTLYEIKEFYKMLNTSVLDSLKVLNSQLLIYTDWCMKQCLVKDGQNHYAEMKRDDFLSCINYALFDKKILTEEELYSIVRQTVNPRDQYALVALFEGLKGDGYNEITMLRPEDIDGNIATLPTGRKIELSNKFISIIEDCKRETNYYGPSERSWPMIDIGYIMKEFPNTTEFNEDRASRRFYHNIKRNLKKHSISENCTPNDIYESGKINMINKRSKELGMSAEEYMFSDHFKEIEDRYGKFYSKKEYVVKYRSYLD